MEGYHHDTANHDVYFEFKEASNCGDSMLSLTPIDMDDSKSVNITTFGVHKFIPSLWPSFQTMFVSEFVEGGTGTKPIQVKSIKPTTFQFIIRFMYMGTLSSSRTALFRSHDSKEIKSSWEEIYVAADRFRIDNLRKLALSVIFKYMGATATIGFLFRTAYLHKELKESVIKCISRKCHSDIAKKRVQDSQKNYPEFSDLLGELYDAYHEMRSEKECTYEKHT